MYLCIIINGWNPVRFFSGSAPDNEFLKFIDLKFFQMHSLLKPYNLFYSNGVAILSCFHDIQQRTFQSDLPML